MKVITEPAREIPVMAEVDVLVLGSGPAGIGAAVEAGRSGMKTMLVEQFGDVGGVATVGLMSHWTGDARGGLYYEMLERTVKQREELETESGAGRATINPERLKTLLLEMLEEAGVEVLLYTVAAEAIMDGETISGVFLEGKSGRTAVLAKQIIDATGDGDIAARAGAPFTKGREDDGKMQPLTLMFKVAGVELDRGVFPGSFESNLDVPLGKIQDLAHEHIPHPAGHCLLYKTTLPGVVTCNMTNIIGVDATDSRELSRAHITCRKQIDTIVSFLHKCVPGFEKCYVISVASFVGIRETRHFKGEYTLTAEDIVEAKVFPDWVVPHAKFNFDIHNIDGAGLDKNGAQNHFPQKRGYTIPYGCLVPIKIENLLLAGRNISGTHKAHSNYRVMPICMNMGQAAGAAAAIAIKSGRTPRQVKASEIQEHLLAHGAIAPEAVEA
ncbi:MAG: FAD-dependent oxidoreductase [Planctomycetes bacterium]|nr:FAD-dependent oxidoreductase [Planctomycetota bacterium]